MGDRLPGVVLPDSGRSQQLMRVTTTGPGSCHMIAVPEDDAISLTIYVTAITQPTILDIRIEEIGASSTNKRLIKRVPQIRVAETEPVTFVLPIGGRALITADFTGVVSFEIHGKSASAAATTEVIIPPPSAGEEEFWNRNRHLLIDIHDTLLKMNNHLRLITGMEKEQIDGGDF